MAKKAENNKPGQPTKYKAQYCQKIIKFFDIEPWEERKIPHYEKSGKTDEEGNPIVVWEDIKLLPNRMPTLRKFAKSISVSYVTVYNWVKKHKDFLNAFTCAQEIRKDWLIDLGLSGQAPPASFKFVAINVTDMRDKTETEVGGKDGLPIQVSIVDFAKINDDTQ